MCLVHKRSISLLTVTRFNSYLVIERDEPRFIQRSTDLEMVRPPRAAEGRDFQSTGAASRARVSIRLSRGRG